MLEENFFPCLFQFLEVTCIPLPVAPSSTFKFSSLTPSKLFTSNILALLSKVSYDFCWALRLPISGSVSLIISGKSSLPCKVTCLQVLGIRMWTSVREEGTLLCLLHLGGHIAPFPLYTSGQSNHSPALIQEEGAWTNLSMGGIPVNM